MHIGDKIDAVLKQKDMKRTAMGKKIGAILGVKPPSSQAMRGWITTGRIDKNWLSAIAQSLDVSLEWLINSQNLTGMENTPPVSGHSIPVEVAKHAVAQAYAAAQAVGNLDSEQFVKMFLLFCKVDERPAVNPPSHVQTIEGNHNTNTQMGNITVGK
jgi:hypothetical protein